MIARTRLCVTLLTFEIIIYNMMRIKVLWLVVRNHTLVRNLNSTASSKNVERENVPRIRSLFR